MSATNAMKRVTKNVTKREPKKAPKKNPVIKTFGIQRKDPNSIFRKIAIEDVSDALEAYVASLKLTLDAKPIYIGNLNVSHPTDIDQSKLNEISTVRMLKTSVPWTILLDFLHNLKSETLSVSFAKYRTQPGFQDSLSRMKQIIKERSASGIPLPAKDFIAPKPIPIQKKEPIKRLKYDHKTLEAMSTAGLLKLARSEKVETKEEQTGRKTAVGRKETISKLMNIEDVLHKDTERKYETDIADTCVSAYRNAPWMKLFTDKPIIGIAVPRESEYATSLNVVGNWYKVKSTFYRDACTIGRKYSPDAVAYVTWRDPKIIIETKEMYDASLRYKPEIPSKLEMLQSLEPTPAELVAAEQSQSVKFPDAITPVTQQLRRRVVAGGGKRSSTDVPAPAVLQQEKVVLAKPEVELAPGLFSHLKNIIYGPILTCDQCGVLINQPALKSTYENQIVMFCSTECYGKYRFKNEKQD